MLDAPGHASCDDLKSCAGAKSAVPSDVPVCDSQTLIGRSVKQARAVSVACAAFGEHCFTTRVGGLCGLGECEAGETCTCDGDSIIACVQGVRTKTPCGAGMTCGEQVGTHTIDCIGKGASCSADRCDGNVAVMCEGASGAGREARIDCSKWGLACKVAGHKALCVPKQTGCDSSKDPARCKGSALEICVAGAWWDVSCSSLKTGTQCKSGIGCAGEAGCG